MADLTTTVPTPPAAAGHKPPWLTRLIASPRFQAWAARFPLTKRIVAREGAAMFDIVAGFCHSQILQAIVAFDIPNALLGEELTAKQLAQRNRVPEDRMDVLLQGAAALGLLKVRRNGAVRLTTRGAALAGVPGLQGMIAHHDVLYRDLADPVAFFRGETETELAHFWPYVFGAEGAADPDVAATYSQLMSDTQMLVAQDTLDAVRLKGVRHLMDVGGGTGAFLGAVAQRRPDLKLTLFDLPAVVPAATERFAQLGAMDRVTICAGSFRDDPLPEGADAISLVRVLYDHSDDTVMDLLRACHRALPQAGQLIVSEPMAGSRQPERAGDAYFALYCMAMRTGRARSAERISAMLADAGFNVQAQPTPRRPFITSTILAVRNG